MSATILAAYDPRARDRGAIDFGVALAELTGARLIVASVQAGDPVMGVFPGTALPYAVGRVDEDLVPDCSEALDEIAPDLRARGVIFECRAIDGLSAARALQQAAEAAAVALLVVGAGRRRVLGSTAQRLLHGAPCPVAVVGRELQRVVAALHDVAVDAGALLGDPAEKLVELSDQLDVLVCGSRGYGPVRAVLLGSVSRRLVAEAHCPVIVLPHGVSGRLEALAAGLRRDVDQERNEPRRALIGALEPIHARPGRRDLVHRPSLNGWPRS